MTVKDSCIQMYAEFRYRSISSRPSTDDSNQSVSNMISSNEYTVITLALLLIAVLLAICLKDVGTVSRIKV